MSLEPGCYLDSHRGHYIFPEIIRLAEGYGRFPTMEIQLLLARYDELEDEQEIIVDESDRAIEWLNNNVSLEGHRWDWNDGDFGLYANEEEE